MREVLKRHGCQPNDGTPQIKTNNQMSDRETRHQKTKQSQLNGTFLARNGPLDSLLDPERSGKEMHEARASEDFQKSVGISKYVKSFSISLGPEALSHLVKLLFKVLAELKINLVNANLVRLRYTALNSTWNTTLSLLVDYHEGSTVMLSQTNFRILHRLVASV